jgi:hypothetical protein
MQACLCVCVCARARVCVCSKPSTLVTLPRRIDTHWHGTNQKKGGGCGTGRGYNRTERRRARVWLSPDWQDEWGLGIAPPGGPPPPAKTCPAQSSRGSLATEPSPDPQMSVGAAGLISCRGGGGGRGHWEFGFGCKGAYVRDSSHVHLQRVGEGKGEGGKDEGGRRAGRREEGGRNFPQ